MLIGPLCDVPGSFVTDANGHQSVVGSTSTPDLSWLKVPPGFCVHYFGNVGDARQIRFAPGGELFVSSPSQGTTGGNGSAGQRAIVVLSDDDNDGFADASPSTFLGNLPETQGIMFANGFFYYQDGTKIMRMPYETGDRVGDASKSEVVADITIYSSSGHWPKTLDIADDGSIYVGNGGDQGEQCIQPMPFHGGILKLDGTSGGNPIINGLRNPIDVKCQRGHNNCFSVELALDYSGPMGGREKLFKIHAGDNWGYPCCATQNLPYAGVPAFTPQMMPTGAPPDCSKIAPESNAFIIGETPFGFDFEPGSWPAPWTSRVFVAMHGVFGTWQGARVVGIETDPSTGLVLPSSDLDGGTSTTLSDFATGWDDGRMDHGRPADITIAPDGRLFLANDVSGDIVWIAPAN